MVRWGHPMTVASQRFRRDRPCPVCGGYPEAPHGRGVRDWGFLSDDGEWAHCTREERAGTLQMHDCSATYAHRLTGDCKCGMRHGTDGRASVTRSRVWSYAHPSGVVVEHHREDRTDGSKSVWWERDGRRGLGGLPVAELPLCGVDELAGVPQGSRVVLVEGEKAREELARRGIIAIASITGARSIPSDASLRPLLDYSVLTWPDADTDGRPHMRRIADRLRDLGHRDIRILDWPDAPEAGDAADFFASGGTVADFEARAEAAPEWSPDVSVREVSARFVEVAGDELARSSTDTHDLPFLPFIGVSGYVVEGWSHLVAAYPRAGKTELLIRQVRDWLALGKSVLYITEESRPMWEFRLSHLPGEWSRLRVVFGLGSDPVSLLARAAEGAEEIVVLDAVRNLLQLRDENDNSELARITNPWVAKARETGKTLVVVHHMRKGSGQHGEGIAGGHAILGSFDIALEILRDDHSQRRRKIRAYCRLIQPDELLYELTEGGEIVSLGDPKEVGLAEVAQRVLDVLGSDWEKTENIVKALEEPVPSREGVRKALLRLAGQGQVDRDPPLGARAPGVTHLWRRAGQAGHDLTSTKEPTSPPPKGGGVGGEVPERERRPVNDQPPPTGGLLGGGEVDPMLRAARDSGLAAEYPSGKSMRRRRWLALEAVSPIAPWPIPPPVRVEVAGRSEASREEDAGSG